MQNLEGRHSFRNIEIYSPVFTAHYPHGWKPRLDMKLMKHRDFLSSGINEAPYFKDRLQQVMLLKNFVPSWDDKLEL